MVKTKRNSNQSEKVEVSVRIKLDKISLLDVDPTKEGVWARNTALVFNEDDTKAYIHKPYLDALTKDVDPKEK